MEWAFSRSWSVLVVDKFSRLSVRSPSSSDSELKDGPTGGIVGGRMFAVTNGDVDDMVLNHLGLMYLLNTRSAKG